MPTTDDLRAANEWLKKNAPDNVLTYCNWLSGKLQRPGKVKVRIAVAVGPDGSWNAAGWDDGGVPSVDTAMELAVEPIKSGEARYWVEIELDIPHEQTREVTDAQVHRVSV